MSEQPEVKKSKVTEAVSAGFYKSEYGVMHNGEKVMFKHNIAFENGDKGQYSCKQESQTKFVIGNEVDYEYTGGQWPKIKPIQQNNFNGNTRKSDPEADRKRSILIIFQSFFRSSYGVSYNKRV
ncbi:unnamed protein product [marine sediment metagenome]|uniref:Uncharacterized protein n=1 Tax=marine sediment metagenome TaxID=412755 RepID=X0VJ38_9ZZZZ